LEEKLSTYKSHGQKTYLIYRSSQAKERPRNTVFEIKVLEGQQRFKVNKKQS